MEELNSHAWGNDQSRSQNTQQEQFVERNFNNDAPSQSPEGPPGYGLMSRTLVHSPVIKQIIPARIRSKDLNDVIFIGETFIELHLLTDDGKLRQVGSKTDFQANIRHARVFGSPRKNFNSAQEAIFKQELATRSQDDVVMRGGGGISGRQSQRTEGEDFKSLLPPHILVLTLDSGHLAFVYARDSEKQGEVNFVVSMKRIDQKGIRIETLGKSIAVDPRSRAIAVAAYQDSFRMYALHPMEVLERQLREGLPLNPIKEEKSFEVKGLIMHMEFLHPSPDDQDHVILLAFVIDSNQKSRLQLFEWWSSKPLWSSARHGQHGFRLAEDISMPVHVIPLVMGSAFLLVTEFSTHVVKASDIMSGTSSFAKIAFPPAPPNGQRRSLVTSWARPLRTPQYAYDHDDMYLAMEDGDIYFLEVDTQGPNLIQLANKACRLDCSIGTAFASLDYGLNKNDMLVAGGEMSSGGVYLLKIGPHPAEAEPKLEESVANWSPVFDFELVNLPVQGHASGKVERDRVLACTGRGDHGAITELRYGIQARIQGSADHQMRGVRRLWVLPDCSDIGYFLFSSLPDQSNLCFLKPDGEWEDASDFELLEMNETTLAVGVAGRHSVQVTPSAINIAQLKHEHLASLGRDVEMADEPQTPMMRRRCGDGDVIVAAALKENHMVVAIRNGFLVKLILATIVIDGNIEDFLRPVGLPTSLAEDPTFIAILEINGQILAAVGTRQATIQLFLFDYSNGLVPHLEKSLVADNHQGELDLFICECAVIIMANDEVQMLCGLRGGTVVVMNVQWGRCLSLERIDEVKFGPTPVQIYPDVSRDDSAFVLAGPELFRFDLPSGNLRASQVVFEESDVEPSLVAFAQIDTSPNPENIVVGVTRDQIFFADVGESEKVCVRRLRLHETPRRLLFYKPLNILIVACSRTASDDPRVENENHIPGKRRSFCSLRFLDPRTGQSKADIDIRDSSKKDIIFGKANEQIYCLTEWSMEIEGKNYRYIVIGTGYINVTASNLHKGRVLVLSVTLGSSGGVEVRRRYQIQCEAPVYSIAPYGNSSLVYCSGQSINMRTFNAQTKKFDIVAETKLRSPAVQITVTEPWIQLSCGEDSMLVLKFEDEKFNEFLSDEVARNGLHHFQIFQGFFLATDKELGVVGLWQPPDRRNVESLVTVVEAELTSSISRIRQGNIRPPWHMKGAPPGTKTLGKDLIASGIDGSMFHLTLLEEDALHLLRYIQDLYRTKAGIGRYSPQDIEGGGRDPRMGHVDGDILVTVLGLGSGWMREMLMKVDEAGGSALPSFTELVGRVPGVSEVGSDPIDAVMKYMNDLVHGVVL